MRIESRPWAFQRAINQGCASPITSQNGDQIPKFVLFCRHFDRKPLKVCYKLWLSKNFQRQSCSAVNYLSKGINILEGDDPFPVIFGLKAPTSNRKDARFTFYTRRAVQSAIANLVNNLLVYIKVKLNNRPVITHDRYRPSSNVERL